MRADRDAVSDRVAGDALPAGWSPGFTGYLGCGVLDADGREQGIIRSEGLVPGVRYAMRRNGELVWRLSVRLVLFAIATPWSWLMAIHGRSTRHSSGGRT